MKESITIQHLGPIEDICIPDIKPFTLIIGESASGKSTILKVVALFRYLYKMVNIRSYLKNANILRSPFRLRLDKYLKNCGLEMYVGEHTVVVYSVEEDGRLYTLEYRNKKLSVTPTIANKDLSFFKVSFISENRNVIPSWSSKASVNKNASLGFYFHETYEDFEDATESIKEMNLNFLGLRLDVKKSNKGKKYLIAPLVSSYAPLELKNASSGIQTSVPLIVITHYFAQKFSFKEAFKRSVLDYLYESERLSRFTPQIELTELRKYVHIHIEEPELSLYPDAQCDLIDTLVKEAFLNKAADRELTLMMATHSPYIINQLNVLLRTSYCREDNPGKTFLEPDKVAVYKIVNGKLNDLMAIDKRSGERVVNTIDLSETMNRIYSEYNRMKK